MSKLDVHRFLMRISVPIILVAVVGIIYFKQHAFVYHLRPYDEGYAYALPENGEELHYSLPFGKQIAFYIPATNGSALPRRIWFAFCGNGSPFLPMISNRAFAQSVIRSVPRSRSILPRATACSASLPSHRSPLCARKPAGS